MNFKTHRVIILIFRLILGTIFLTSAFGKFIDLERYSVDAIYEFGILPMGLARPFGLVMPFVELLCGLGLLFGVLTRLSALGIALLSLSFFTAKAIVLSQHRNIDCGCFGAITDTLVSLSIYMDVPLMILALMIMFANSPARHWKTLGDRLSLKWKKKFDLIW